jgi:hypothetical protein
MHPSMAREIIRQHESELRQQARRDGAARMARRAAKAQRAADAAAKAREAAIGTPRAPRYVDGTCEHAGA